MKIIFKVLLLLPFLMQITNSSAQAFPSRPLTLVAPAAAGGPTDIVARIVAPILTENIGQSVIVENRGGAGLTVGTEHVARSKPDGYTLGVGSPSSHSIPPSLYPKLPYDPIKDFAPIVHLVNSVTVLVVNPTVPAKSLKNLVALVRSKPGQINFGSGGNGTVSQLTGELFKITAGINMVHIPYKGSGPATIALMGGEIDMMFHSLHLSIPYIKSGKLRGIGVTTLERSALMPEMPTMNEAGLPGFQVTTWYGVFAPAGTPRDIVAKLNSAILKGIISQETRRRLANQGLEVAGGSPEQFSALINEDLQKWAKVVKQSGAKVD